MPDHRERLVGLLRPGTTPTGAAEGFLDLLGEITQAGPPTGLAQRLMSTSAVPMIYERYWRPVLGRVAKGLNCPSMAGEVRIAIEALGLRPGQISLDVACGTGRFTRAFGEAVGPDGLSIGLDGSVTMLEKALAEPNPASVAYLRADAVDLPLADSTVDGVCCFAALHMFADPDAALDSFARVLKPGGSLVLLTSARHSDQPMRLADTFLGRLSGQRMFDRGEISRKLFRRGFDHVEERFSGVTQIVTGALPVNIRP
ncbi:class I SAM-dependent methyltransferase [Amycolatopsis regifaucium]|uniref:Methyltransferase type 11 n=1 Tax=Amycolatopsis regifaucium TaxID=546365 RepID=A0A154MH38_9PSEU|nr:methyltransferase domain-containing protein [Amycolatopsis regifaucium]KZB83742.1 methyltransferase type 11 [Amycolatopsis regifaucium]OKA06817.1 methyltransferase type 11 [Amycolatopsis regifaucium]SFH27364.1 Ubiquinone/menaquinone biosynthesis C-methylase UbiE [Amycolatopsis regifaucium]